MMLKINYTPYLYGSASNGENVIKALEMYGGENPNNLKGNDPNCLYTLGGGSKNTIIEIPNCWFCNVIKTHPNFKEIEVYDREWHYFEDKLPPKNGKYIMCSMQGRIETVNYDAKSQYGGEYAAWMQLPIPPLKKKQ